MAFCQTATQQLSVISQNTSKCFPEDLTPTDLPLTSAYIIVGYLGGITFGMASFW